MDHMAPYLRRPGVLQYQTLIPPHLHRPTQLSFTFPFSILHRPIFLVFVDSKAAPLKWYFRRLIGRPLEVVSSSTLEVDSSSRLPGTSLWPLESCELLLRTTSNERAVLHSQMVSRTKSGGSRPEHPTKKTPEVTTSNALRAQLVWYGFCRTQGFIVGSCGTFHSAVGSCGFFIVGSCSGNGLVFVMDLVARTEFLKLNVSTARIVSEWQRGSSMKRDGGVPASRR